MYAIVVILGFGLATGYIGKSKGSSFWIWFIIGLVTLVIGLVAAVIYKGDGDEPERLCPSCGMRHKISVQVCRNCGVELYFPAEGEILEPGQPSAPIRRAA